MLLEKKGEARALEWLDLVKYFDSENLTNNLAELYKAKVKGKEYRLVHEMNIETKLKVRTPVGDSETRTTTEGKGQS